MPQASFDYEDNECDLLDRVQQRKGLTDRNQAAEWLVKARLRRAAIKLTGRNRALYEV
ncbi:hypothetical protein ACFQDN_21320 [Pseudomonas asuensis]|uniref:Uncharacterized protein n=1 Tax=Pseudomonas asuensis TaxID=1825787 RepID=A0ABQ2H3U3_9PSED|nr:hypothetical protein [Pseudomonas asuensis]GGM33054.1 hypothetical protein GCM10009425_49410 [Pseudomonas asuensis]